VLKGVLGVSEVRSLLKSVERRPTILSRGDARFGTLTENNLPSNPSGAANWMFCRWNAMRNGQHNDRDGGVYHSCCSVRHSIGVLLITGEIWRR
jgi:hypothetical protein